MKKYLDRLSYKAHIRNYACLCILCFLLGCKSLPNKEIVFPEKQYEDQILRLTNIVISRDSSEISNLYRLVDDKYQIKSISNNDYLLVLKVSSEENYNALTFASAILCFTPQLIGIPAWFTEKVTISADFMTKYGTPIKNYTATGSERTNIAGLLYGYNTVDAEQKSVEESFNDAYDKLLKMIDSDESLKIEARKNLKADKKMLLELNKVTGGKKVFIMENAPSLNTIDKSNILYFPWYGHARIGLFAGQNVHNGNLADYHHLAYYNYNTTKVFLYGNNDYIDGVPISGYYKYVGTYTYTSVLGATHTVPALKKVSIKPQYEKYISFVE